MKRHISLAAAIVPSLRGRPGASSRAIAGPRPARRRVDLVRRQAVFPFLFAVIGMAPAIGVSTQPPPELGPDAPLAIVSLDTIGKEWGIGGIIGNVVGPDGSVYLVDRLNHQVLRVSPQGELVWRVGRQGRGPGEYMVPYRVAVRETGEVLVLDQSTREVTTLDAEGSFLERSTLPFDMGPQSMRALPDGGLAFTGVAPPGSPGEGAAIHVFGADLEHRASFGPLPATRDDLVLRYWGSGVLTIDRGGSLFYTRKLPHEVYRYEPDGTLREVVRAPLLEDARPDDAVAIQRSGARVSVRYLPGAVAFPLPARDLGDDLILGGRIGDGDRYWDFFRDGELIGSYRMPDEWKLLGIDHQRDVLWMSGSDDLEPVLLRLRFERVRP